jgi:hypothetical protein
VAAGVNSQLSAFIPAPSIVGRVMTTKQFRLKEIKMSNNKKLVWGLFENMATAETAAYAMKGWDKASKDVKLGAIGAVYKNSKGSIKTKCRAVADG